MFGFLKKIFKNKERKLSSGSIDDGLDSFYKNDKDRILEMVEDMGSSVCRALEDALTSLKERDRKLADKVIEKDDIIDILEVELNRECLSLIAMRKPVREELRFVFAVLKIATDLERIGDQAVNVSQRAKVISDYPPLKPYLDIALMTEIAIEMVQSALKAFFEGDTELAIEVFRKDRKLDSLAEKLSEEILNIMTKAKKGNVEKIRISTELFLTARHLERVGDHASNIAERVFFMVRGERLKDVVLGEKDKEIKKTVDE